MDKKSNRRDSLLMNNLKTVNDGLVKHVVDCRKQIEQLRSQLTSTSANYEIFHGIERDVFALVLSSNLREATARRTAAMAAATETARNLTRKTESAAAKVDAEEMRLRALVREKDEKKKELAVLKERISRKEGRLGKQWRKWLFPAVFAALSVALVWTKFWN